MKNLTLKEIEMMFREMGLATPSERKGFLGWEFPEAQKKDQAEVLFIRLEDSTLQNNREHTNAELARPTKRD